MNRTVWLLLGGVSVLAVAAASLLLDEGTAPLPTPPPSLGTGPATIPSFRPEPVAKSEPPPPLAEKPVAQPGRLVASPENLQVTSLIGNAVRGTVQLLNAGGERLSLSLALSGDGSFQLENVGCPEALDPGQSCVVGLTYRPQTEGAQLATLQVQPAVGQALSVKLGGLAVAPERTPTPPPPKDTSLRDSLRSRRLSGLPAGVGEPPPQGAPKAAQEQYEARQREFRTVNNVPAPSSTQADYGGYPGYVSSLPVDSCRVIGPDSVITARLQTYIDSAQCGEVRATVDRHVYNSGGNASCRTVLIPAGSTLIGECTGVGGSQDRVDIRWRRIIRAGDRAHILIEEAASDALGRKGLPGTVDRGTDRALLATLIGAAVNAATGGLVGALDRSTITSAIDITTGLATSVQNNRSPAGEAARAFGQSMADGVNTIVASEMERLRAQAQVVVPPGTLITVVPTTDLWIRSPQDGPQVLGDARNGLGDRLNPQFQSQAAQAQAAQSAFAARRDAASVPTATGYSSTNRFGTVQQSGQVLQPGQSAGFGTTASGVSVQRVRPGASW